MKRRKNRIIFGGLTVIVVLTIGVVLLWYVPNAPIKDSKKIEYLNIYKIVDAEHVEITDEIDVDALKELLPMIRAKKTFSDHAPRQMSEHLYEIDCVYDKKPVHILLTESKDSYLYESWGCIVYRIDNPESWKKLIQILMQS